MRPSAVKCFGFMVQVREFDAYCTIPFMLNGVWCCWCMVQGREDEAERCSVFRFHCSVSMRHGSVLRFSGSVFRLLNSVFQLQCLGFTMRVKVYGLCLTQPLILYLLWCMVLSAVQCLGFMVRVRVYVFFFTPPFMLHGCMVMPGVWFRI